MAIELILWDTDLKKKQQKTKNKQTDYLKTDFNKYSDNNQQKKCEVD